MFDVVYKDPDTKKLYQFTVFAVLRDRLHPTGPTKYFLVWDGRWMEIDADNCTPVTRRGADMKV